VQQVCFINTTKDKHKAIRFASLQNKPVVQMLLKNHETNFPNYKHLKHILEQENPEGSDLDTIFLIDTSNNKIETKSGTVKGILRYYHSLEYFRLLVTVSTKVDRLLLLR
jgi:hypothetical protein